MEKMYPKTVQSTPKCLHHPPPSQIQNILTSPAIIKLSRRDLTICTKSSLLLLLTSQFHLPIATAAPSPQQQEEEDNLFTTKPPEPIDENPLDTNTITTPTEENPLETNTVTTGENPAATGATTIEDNQVKADATTTEESPVENVAVTTENGTATPESTRNDCTDKVLTKRAFLDISVDGKPIGRIVIGLYGNNVPAGATRFGDFVSGAAGVSYRRKEFVKITPSYVQHGGVRSYGVDAELAAKTGQKLGADNLIVELERENGRCPGIKNVAGTVGIVVRDPFKPPPKQKLVARQGKLVIDEEEVGKDPNGTEFVITTKDSPELDASTLVVGKVLEGLEVVERMGQVKTVQENTSSPYFRVAKLIGDKRAVVAERGFNRPYSKVVVTNCGLMA